MLQLEHSKWKINEEKNGRILEGETETNRERERDAGTDGAGHLAQGEEVQMVLLYHVLSIRSSNDTRSLLEFAGRMHSSLRVN